MTIYLNPTEAQKEEQEHARIFRELENNWARLLEVILEDSSVVEIETFALRLSEIPQYTEKQEYAREISRYGYTHHRVFDPVYMGGRIIQGGFRSEKIPFSEPVETIALSPTFCKKGKKSWIITI